MKIEPIVPFEPISTFDFPQGENWIAQVKWDGTRILTYYNGEQALLYNRKLNDRTLQYPELTQPIQSYCSASSVILDGEVIALEEGTPSFHEVMKRDSLRKVQNIRKVMQQVPVIYMVFDVLFYNGQWVTDKPLNYRQSLLEDIITPNENVQIIPSYEEQEELYETVKEHHLEGIVCKDKLSSYSIEGKDRRWQKMKYYKDIIAVVGGVTHRSGTVNALLLGLYDVQGNLWYIGHAGTGKLTQEDWRTVTTQAQQIRTESKPFYNTPERSNDATWLMPIFTVKVKFIEWTHNQTMRQPSIQAFVNIPPKDCKFGL